jgi:DNA modification methylase
VKGHDTDGQPNFRSSRLERQAVTRNRRDVWTITTKPFKGAHFATMPVDLVEPCIKAGSRPGDVVLDPFAGAGTVGLVASRLGRRHVGVELSLNYCRMAEDRIYQEAPLWDQRKR